MCHLFYTLTTLTIISALAVPYFGNTEPMAPNAAPLQEVPSAMQYTQIHTANSRVNNETMLIKDLFRSVVTFVMYSISSQLLYRWKNFHWNFKFAILVLNGKFANFPFR